MFALIALTLALLLIAAVAPSYPASWYGNWGPHTR